MVKSKDDKKFAQLLRSEIEASSFNQSSLATSMSTTRAYVNSLTNGTRLPTADRIDEISEKLSLSDGQTKCLHKAAAQDLIAERGFRIDLPDDW